MLFFWASGVQGKTTSFQRMRILGAFFEQEDWTYLFLSGDERMNGGLLAQEYSDPDLVFSPKTIMLPHPSNFGKDGGRRIVWPRLDN